MEMLIIKRDSPEWNWMWSQLASHPLNEGIEESTVALNTLNGEAWQYMGSYRGKDGTVVSEFRHRSHPFDNERRYIKFIHVNVVSESNIEKVIPIK